MRTVKRKLVYLVRTHKGVEIHQVKPSDVVFHSRDKNYWHVRTFRFRVGEACPSLLYSDNWLGTIGVYDVSDTKQVLEMFKQFESHLRSILLWNVKCELADNGVLMVEMSKKPPKSMVPTMLAERLKDVIWPT